MLLVCERLDATYAINFAFPFSFLSRGRNFRWKAISAEEVRRSGSMLETAYRAFREFRPSLLIVSRAADDSVVTLMAEARKLNIGCVFHLDDLLCELPQSLPAEYQETYGADYRACLAEALALADVVWTSTPTLARSVRMRFPGVRIAAIPGVVYLGGQLTPPVARRIGRLVHRLHPGRQGPSIGFMGSRSHGPQLERVAPVIRQVLSEFPDARFEVLGCAVPVALQAESIRATSYGYVHNYADMLWSLYELQWDIGLVVLEDNEFNRAKTVTKFVEYTFAGVATVAPALGMYKDLPPAALGFWDGSSEGLYDRLCAWLRDSAAPQHAISKARTFCIQEYCPQVAAAARLREIDAVLEEYARGEP